jgi:hypothetical protein
VQKGIQNKKIRRLTMAEEGKIKINASEQQMKTLIQRITGDEAFQKEFEGNPKKALLEYGIDIPAGFPSQINVKDVVSEIEMTERVVAAPGAAVAAAVVVAPTPTAKLSTLRK